MKTLKAVVMLRVQLGYLWNFEKNHTEKLCLLVVTKGSQLFNFSIVGKNMQKCT